MNYDGVMGVPITFIDKHNPNQFEIVGTNLRGLNNIEISGSTTSDPMVNGKTKYKRLFIRRKHS